MAITGVNHNIGYAAYGMQTKKGGLEGTYKNAGEYKVYLTKKYDCLTSKNYQVAINSSFLRETAGDPKKAHWLEYNLALIPETVERTKAQVEASGAKLLSCSITINGYDSMTEEVCTQDVVDPGTEKARKELQERLEKRRAERREKEKVAKRAAEKEELYNMRLDVKA